MESKRKIIWKTAVRIFIILLGAFSYAVGIQWFFTPARLLSGGVTGISMIFNYLWDLPVGVMVFVLNIPIFILALIRYGFKFMLYSIIGMVALSAAIDVVGLVNFVGTSDPFLAAIYGGVLTGLGCGLIYYADATSGGTDIIAKLIKERFPYVNFGTFILLLDALIVTVYAILFKEIDNAMYTVVAVFIASKVIDVVLYGTSQSKLCHIISENSNEIKDAIVASLHRGVTVLHGRGAYSGLDKQILLCVVKRRQIVEIKKIVKSIDRNAFVIVTDTRDVFGRGFTSIDVDR